MFDKLTRGFSNILGALGAAMLAGLMLITSYDVVARYVFKKPFMGTYELSELAIAAVILLGWAYTQVEHAHVDIDLLYSRLPRFVQKGLDLFIPLFGLCFFVFISWQSINFVSESIRWRETTAMLRLPVWTFKLLMSAGAITISLRFLSDFINSCKTIKGKA
ncbi:MAG TPA: TRAP transporter small permease [Spirochaetes bacterium]|nr:TRAP transporter small permease [Spirochaetota bacterium]